MPSFKVNLQNGEEFEFDVLDGKDGVDGAPGQKGDTGPIGEKGEPGKDGRDGIDGKDGTNGRDGVDGKDGKNGVDGKDGRDGVDAKFSTTELKKLAKEMNKDSNLAWQMAPAIKSIVAGTNVTVDNTDPQNPIISSTGSTPGGSGITRSIVVTSGNTNAGATVDVDYVYLIAGAHTITMPTAVSNNNRYTLKNNHSSGVTVNGGGANIDGTATISLAPSSSIDMISNGTNWFIV